jgi:hypothetical protein
MAYLTLKQLRFLNRREVSLHIQSIKVTNNESVLTKTADLLLHKQHKCVGSCSTPAGLITKFNQIKIQCSLKVNRCCLNCSNPFISPSYLSSEEIKRLCEMEVGAQLRFPAALPGRGPQTKHSENATTISQSYSFV